MERPRRQAHTICLAAHCGCLQDYYCPVPATATCVPRLREGELCRNNSSRECQRGLVCGGGRCQAELLYAFSAESRQEPSRSSGSKLLTSSGIQLQVPSRQEVGASVASVGSLGDFLAGLPLEGASTTASRAAASSPARSDAPGGVPCKPWEAELPPDSSTRKSKNRTFTKCENITGKPCQVDRDCLVGSAPFAYCEAETGKCHAPEFSSCLKQFGVVVESTRPSALRETMMSPSEAEEGHPESVAHRVMTLLLDSLAPRHDTRQSNARESWREAAHQLLCCLSQLDELNDMIDFHALSNGRGIVGCPG